MSRDQKPRDVRSFGVAGDDPAISQADVALTIVGATDDVSVAPSREAQRF